MRGLNRLLPLLGCLAVLLVVLGGIGVAGEPAPGPPPAPLLLQPQEAAPVPLATDPVDGPPAFVTPGETSMGVPALPVGRPFAGWIGLTTRLPLDRRGLGVGGLRQRQGAEEPEHSIWWGEAMGVPTFNWGYFGVPGRKYVVDHEAYYGDYQEWGVRRGY